MSELQYAGFWRRWIALLIDQIVIQIGSSILLTLSLWVNGVGQSDVSGETLQLLGGLAYLGVAIPYFVVCHQQWGRTPGKRILGVQVVDAFSLGRLSWAQSFGRSAGQFLSGALFLVGYLMAAVDPRKRTLHDRLAGTVCIRVPG